MSDTSPSPAFVVGAAEVDITPEQAMFLFGYPHVERQSTGVHDRLLAAALYVSDGERAVIFVSSDIIWVPRDLARRARDRIAQLTGVPADHVMVTASHTHSGPVTAQMLSNEGDDVVPPPDPAYLARLEQGIVNAAEQACRTAAPARLSLATADGTGLGTNRRDPQGPAIPRIPVLVAHALDTQRPVALMAVCSMHPTVLHEDSTLTSGDFPGIARLWLQQHAVGADCPFIYHMGASGDQSPRHVVRGQTFDEARRLGETLGRAIAGALDAATPLEQIGVACDRRFVDLPLRTFPDVAAAQAHVDQTRARLAQLREREPASPATRTAETDWFGAEETLTLARAAAEGRVERAAATCMPAEIQHIRIGTFNWIGWPGEVFVAFAIDVMRRVPDTAIITLANGDLQGYLVTEQAVGEGGYEASNALFQSPVSGQRLVEATLDLLGQGVSRTESR